jgi:hypothetical protein
MAGKQRVQPSLGRSSGPIRDCPGLGVFEVAVELRYGFADKPCGTPEVEVSDRTVDLVSQIA